MDKLLSSRGLDLVRFKGSHVFDFVNNMSAESKKEMLEIHDLDPLAALVPLIKDPLTHCVLKDNVPLAVVGLVEQEPDDDGRTAHIWALFAEDIKKNRPAFLRASIDLIKYYHTQFPTIHGSIWTGNMPIVNWMFFLKFKTFCIEEKNGESFIGFVRCVQNNFQSEGELSRPVLH